jgi:hypothetical protein
LQPTKNEDLGVLGNRAAIADENRRAKLDEAKVEQGKLVDPDPEMRAMWGIQAAEDRAIWAAGREHDLRLGVLNLAQNAPTSGILTPADVVTRATAYLAFIKGENHG